MQNKTELCFHANASGKSNKCLSELNAAREAAGLPNFTEATDGKKLSDPEQQLQEGSEWMKVCKHLVPVSGAEYF